MDPVGHKPPSPQFLLWLLEEDPYYYVYSVALSYVKHKLTDWKYVQDAMHTYPPGFLIYFMRCTLLGVKLVDENPAPYKKRRMNPTGENAYIEPNGDVLLDEDKIIAAQRIFLDAHYRPGGVGYARVASSTCLEM